MSERRRSRSRGRAARIAERSNVQTEIVAFIKRKVPFYEMAPVETLELIENNADLILEEIGIEFRDDPEAIEIWKNAGASVEGERVRFERGMLREIIKTNAPSEFIQHARNKNRTIRIAKDTAVLAPAYGPPFVRNLDEGRRYASIEDFRNFVKLTYLSPSLHHSGGTVCEPVDLPVNKRHFDMVYSHLKYSDKPFMGSVTSGERAQDTVDMAKVVFGTDFVENNTCILSLINVNSPMTFDDTMLAALKVYAKNLQGTVISPFILSGAMSPVSIVGTCTQILAEAMAGMAFAQLVRPGAPVIFGTFSSSISMQSGAPTFGTPEPSKVLYLCAALARRLNVPFRSGGGLCASKIPDAQAAYESANTLQTAMLAGVNFMLHTAGWLEGGLVMGYEKFVMDTDQAAMIQEFLSGVDTSENGQALDAIREVGPGNHYLGCEHTQRNFESAFYRSTIADNNSFEQWEADGSLRASQRANKLWRQMLDDYQAPEFDPMVDQELLAFIEKRKASFPDSNV